MNAYTLFMLSGVANGLNALAGLVHMGVALSDGRPVRAIGWSALALAAAILAVAFFLRAQGIQS